MTAIIEEILVVQL